MTAAEFRFVGRATGCDPQGYYHPRWDKAEAVSVVAVSRVEATIKAISMLGAHPRFGVSGFGDARDIPGWAIIWDRADEITGL